MLEFLFGLLAEAFLQIVAELFASFVTKSLADPLRPPDERDPVYAFFGYVLFGMAIGGLSLLVFPAHLINTPHLQVISLFASSGLAGWAVSLMGKWKEKRGKRVIRLDTFFYGFTFAFSIGVIRFVFCTSHPA